MADYQSVWEGKQIDDGLGRIINGELDKLAGQAATSAQYAQAAERGVKDALANIPEGETPIINDLVTGGARMALSAEMGKKLQTEKADAAATAAVAQEIPQGADLDAYDTEGDFYGYAAGGRIAHSPIDDVISLSVRPMGAGLVHQTVKGPAASFERGQHYTADGAAKVWYGWTECATATPPQEYDLQLAAGVTGATTPNYCKNGIGYVSLGGSLSLAAATASQIIATLPAGYRPASAKTVLLQSSTGAAMYGWVLPDGNVRLVNAAPPSGFSAPAVIAIICPPFYAANYGPNALQSQVRMPTVRFARAAIPEEPVDKCMCVVDADGNYAEFVMVTITHDELGALYTVHYYDIVEGEQLIDAVPPIRRPYAGADGFIRPRWDFDAKVWCEDATAEEITAWETEHPAPEPVPNVPSETEQLKAQVAVLEADKAERAELEAMAAAIERGLSI